MPASSERKLAKAPGVGADEVVIDLEDAVAATAKDEARRAGATAIADQAWGDVTVSVRVNAPRSQWCHLDVLALAALPDRPASLVVPKVESAHDLAFVDRLLDGAEAAAERSHRISLQALVESAAGLGRAMEIAAASERLDSLILGYADLAVSLGRSPAGARHLDAWLPAQHTLLTAARAHGLQAIDGPYLGVSPDEPFHAAAERARDLGFDGKWAIHPSQVEPLNDIFSPSAEELARARAIVAALAETEQDTGQGAAVLDGELIDEAMRAGALRVLARAEGDGRWSP